MGFKKFDYNELNYKNLLDREIKAITRHLKELVKKMVNNKIKAGLQSILIGSLYCLINYC